MGNRTIRYYGIVYIIIVIIIEDNKYNILCIWIKLKATDINIDFDNNYPK